MRRSLWSLVLCVGVWLVAWAAAGPVGAERASADRTPAAPVCEATESAEPAGAGAPAEPGGLTCGKCGDRYCNPSCGETATSCPKDCGVPS